MSADNGIYILKTEDQYRVIHAQAIENLFWSHIEKSMTDEIIPTRLVEYFADAEPTKFSAVARATAHEMADDIEFLEYGIQMIHVYKTWGKIVAEAEELFPLEKAAMAS